MNTGKRYTVKNVSEYLDVIRGLGYEKYIPRAKSSI